MTNKSVIVFGPQGCGKTVNGERLAQHFGLPTIVDLGLGPDERRFWPGVGALVLTSETREELEAKGHRRVLPFDHAMAAMRRGTSLAAALNQAPAAPSRRARK
jgi:hypothetical protein